MGNGLYRNRRTWLDVYKRQAMNGAIPEQCRRRSENKIGSPLYIAVQKIDNERVSDSLHDIQMLFDFILLQI